MSCIFCLMTSESGLQQMGMQQTPCYELLSVCIFDILSTTAIHNKDYSVVKTFRPPSSFNTGAFFHLHFDSCRTLQFTIFSPNKKATFYSCLSIDSYIVINYMLLSSLNPVLSALCSLLSALRSLLSTPCSPPPALSLVPLFHFDAFFIQYLPVVCFRAGYCFVGCLSFQLFDNI